MDAYFSVMIICTRNEIKKKIIPHEIITQQVYVFKIIRILWFSLLLFTARDIS